MSSSEYSNIRERRIVGAVACELKLTANGGPQHAQPTTRALEAPVKGEDCGSEKPKSKTLETRAKHRKREQKVFGTLLSLNESTTGGLTKHRPPALVKRDFTETKLCVLA
jgi:hypothetical protein